MENKVIVILGPTASGKSEMAVKLAKKFNGEIISADSRQVYRGMDIGTGKITQKEMRGIPHHLLDVASPKKVFTVIDFKKRAEKAIKDIIKRGKISIICGGTGFYIQAITGGISIPEVKPNWKLRKQLKKKNAEQLFKMLKKLDPKRSKTIDAKNPRRLIRAIELAQSLGHFPRTTLGKSKGSPWEFLQIGINLPKKELEKKIEKKVIKMIKSGLIEETKNLKKSGLTWKRIYELGFEYKYPAMFLRGKISPGERGKKEMLEKIILGNYQYAKRQMTWFSAKGGFASGGKKDPKTKWIENYGEAQKLVRKFL